MIAQIRGILLEANFTEAVVDVHGVGYLIFIPMSTFDKLPQPGEEVVLFTIMHVREDAMSLFGFASQQEKQLFEVLVSVNGVGPRLALSILSSMPVSAFCSAIANSDLNVIKRISGIGKRTAERLIVELRDKVGKLAPEVAMTGDSEVPQEVQIAAADAVAALEQLGFKRESIQKTVNKLIDKLDEKECSTENLIRKALQALNT